MAKYRWQLPQLADTIFLTDGGIETTLIYHDGLDLPYFAAFHLLAEAGGRAALRAYFDTHAAIASRNGMGFILEAPTWRANADWGAKLGYSPDALAEVNRHAIALLEDVRAAYETEHSPMVISGCIGPRGDGYVPGRTMRAGEAEAYHGPQIATFRDSAADMVAAITMNYVEEAIGIARAAAAAGMPAAISFTLETDGRLPTGQTLEEAVEAVDAATAQSPAYYMINCAHPLHFEAALPPDRPWVKRLRGLRANASPRSHAELDAATDLDAGDPIDLGRRYRNLRNRHRGFTVLGGCCGTDHRHIEEIAFACTVPSSRAAA